METLVFSPDESYIAFASGKKLVLIEITSGKRKAYLGHSKVIEDICFSSDGKLVSTASLDNTARIWEVETGITKAILKAHDGRLSTLKFSPDDRILVTAGEDQVIRIWATSNGNLLQNLYGEFKKILKFAFVENGSKLICYGKDHKGKNKAGIWTLGVETPKIKKRKGKRIDALSFVDNERILLSCMDSAYILNLKNIPKWQFRQVKLFFFRPPKLQYT